MTGTQSLKVFNVDEFETVNVCWRWVIYNDHSSVLLDHLAWGCATVPEGIEFLAMAWPILDRAKTLVRYFGGLNRCLPKVTAFEATISGGVKVSSASLHSTQQHAAANPSSYFGKASRRRGRC